MAQGKPRPKPSFGFDATNLSTESLFSSLASNLLLNQEPAAVPRTVPLAHGPNMSPRLTDRWSSWQFHLHLYYNGRKPPTGHHPHCAFVHTLWQDSMEAGNVLWCWFVHLWGHEQEQPSVGGLVYNCSSTELHLQVEKKVSYSCILKYVLQRNWNRSCSISHKF